MHHTKVNGRHLVLAIAGAIVGAALLVPMGVSATPAVTPPPSVAKAGVIHFCTDPTGGPPGSYVNSAGQHLGSDMDIARRLAVLMGVKADIQTISFPNIVPLLNAGTCDAALDGISDTAARDKIENFADYGQAGEEFLVLKGNPKNITSYASLSGKTAGTTVGTVDLMFLQAEDKKLRSEGKPGITIRAFSAANSSYQALIAGQVDAVVGGYTALAGVDKQLSSKVQYGLPAQVNVLPIGIVSAKTNPQLNAAFKEGIAQMYKDGSMAAILKKWGISLTAFSKPPAP